MFIFKLFRFQGNRMFIEMFDSFYFRPRPGSYSNLLLSFYKHLNPPGSCLIKKQLSA